MTALLIVGFFAIICAVAWIWGGLIDANAPDDTDDSFIPSTRRWQVVDAKGKRLFVNVSEVLADTLARTANEMEPEPETYTKPVHTERMP